jgi:hypothetical protein
MQPLERAAARIVEIRGRKVVLDGDLAQLYGVETRVLLQAVRRNAERYPPDFLFILTNQEVGALRSQSVISNAVGRGGRRHARFAFTEHGAIMAATVLNSPRAIEMSVYVVRAFVQLRDAAGSGREITRRLDQLERKVGTHDRAILEILQALRALTQPAEAPKRRRIGFVQD